MIPSLPFLGLLFWKTPSKSCNLPYTVIIPLHNKRKYIQQTLVCVFNQTRKPNSVIVIDDQSTDDSADVVESIGFNLKLIRLKTNIGKARAINEVLYKHVEDPIVMILDADTTMTPDYAEKVIQGFTENVVGVSGRVLSASNETACQKSRVVEYLFGQRLLKSMQAAIGGMWVLAGCATMWQTRWLKESGGMPDNTLVEDLELTWLAQQDHAVNYVHSAICYTEDPKSFKEYISQLYRWLSWRPALGFVDFMKLKIGLKFVIAWQLFDLVMASLFTILTIYLIATGKYEYVLISVVKDFLVYMIISGYEGYKIGKFWDALEGIPNCMILRYVNIVVLLAALIRPKKNGTRK